MRTLTNFLIFTFIICTSNVGAQSNENCNQNLSIFAESAKVKNYEDLQKQKLGSYEIACFEIGLITKDQLSLISQKYNKSDYGQSILQYLKTV